MNNYNNSQNKNYIILSNLSKEERKLWLQKKLDELRKISNWK